MSTDGERIEIDATLAALPPGETILPSTVAAPAGRSEPGLSPLTLPSLPLLAVEGLEPRGESEPAIEGMGDAADLAITGVLGEGGMGRVLLAHQRSLRRDVAIKIVRPGVEDDASLDALLAEAVITGTIEHPNVVPVHALGCDAAGRPILVMKRIEGVAWSALAADPGHPAWAKLSPSEDDRLVAHLEILMSVCNAAHCAHSRGFVHRDIKLDNVMIGEFGEVYLVDWGVATRVAEPGDPGPRRGPLVGTPSYMAKEMVSGDLARIDARTDVYLLGATLHALLTGQPRHPGATIHEALLSAHDGRPCVHGPGVPAELAAICTRATSADPEDRFQSALALRLALADHLRHRGSIALSDEAAARFAELRASGEASSPRIALERMTECRFGFTQALRAWKDNEAAREGLARCLDAMIEHELDQRDAQGARALLAAQSAPRPELERRIAALEAEIEEAARREARLQKIDHDADLRVGARAQLALIGVMALAGVGIASVMLQRGRRPPTHGELVIIMTLLCAASITGVAAGRRHLQTAVSRRMAGILVLVTASMLGNRLLGAVLDAPIPSILSTDLWIFAAVLAAGSLTLQRWLAWGVLPLLLANVTIALRPDLQLPAFGGGVLGSVTLIALLWRRATRA